MKNYWFYDGHYISMKHAIILDSKTHCSEKKSCYEGHYIRLKHVIAVDSAWHDSKKQSSLWWKIAILWTKKKIQKGTCTRNYDRTRSQAVSAAVYVSRTAGLFFVYTSGRGLRTSCDLRCLLFHVRVKLRS
jgi:hypothetical protein